MSRIGLQIVAPRQQPQKQERAEKDWMDKLMAGVQIVNGMTNIGTDVFKIKKQMALDNNELNAQEQAETAAKDYDIADTRQGENSIAFTDTASEKQRFMNQRKEPEKLPQLIPAGNGKIVQRNADGSMSTAWEGDKQVVEVQKADGSKVYEEKRPGLVSAPPGSVVAKGLTVPRSGEIKPGKKSYEEIVGKLNAAEKLKVGQLAEMQLAAEEMRTALEAGDSPGRDYIPFAGDNDFTRALKKYNSALQRMESGAGTSPSELEFYKKMAPTLWDGADQRLSKLKDVRGRTGYNIGLYGLDPKDVYRFRTEAGDAGSPGDADSAPEAPKKKVERKQYSKSLNKTRITYSDGTVEEIDGQQ